MIDKLFFCVKKNHSELRRSMLLAFPLITSNLVQVLNGFISVVIIAYFGVIALAASILGFTIYSVLVDFCAGSLVSMAIFISRNHGQNKIKKVQEFALHGVLTALLFGIISAFLLRIISFILIHLIAENTFILMTSHYLNSLSLCLVPLCLLISIEQFYIGISETRIIFWLTLVQIPIELGLIYIFAFGKLGITAMHLSGVGYGLSIAYTIDFLIAVMYIQYLKTTRPYNVLKSKWVINKSYIVKLIKVGVPIGLTNVIESIQLMSAAIMASFVSVNALAAFQIIRQFWKVSFVITTAMSQATNVRIGQIGYKGNKGAVTSVINVNLFFVLSMLLILGLVYILMPEKLVDLDIDKNATGYLSIVHMARIFFIFVAILQILDGLRYIFMGALRALKDTVVPMYISFVASWCIGIPLAYITCFSFGLSIYGIWIGILISILLCTVLLIGRYTLSMKLS